MKRKVVDIKEKQKKERKVNFKEEYLENFHHVNKVKMTMKGTGFIVREGTLRFYYRIDQKEVSGKRGRMKRWNDKGVHVRLANNVYV